ncbi:Iwr1 domain-containing protein [Aspergillus clavatus NRRL 1]|uniref:Transcription factor Iwr1 domain-containing protein n=1 Tax=Aspergillus clavatus (strain ATCC 1007 / CBS 513.65 / DSM 816 / NCTC 3887 / NRRL 1 / QM 1276 / 107) TaxID=344612 RepID=A1C617_ASPCL|nr:uncharacterized protein ACLA_068660 [Aspergillus clavatus NRRL 1]EAW13838.1 conserved hypothetical protein [Aspergillus clavatus NRRL 1]
MSLPPEQINIKRRREEEPVDTLYIQSQLHQTKRRFTDFVFQRVQVGGKGKDPGAPSPASPAPSRTILNPRSVSSSAVRAAAAAATGATGATVPLVRATSPGAEFREERRLAAARKEAEEKVQRALRSSPVVAPRDELLPAPTPAPAATPLSVSGSGDGSAVSSGRGSPALSSPRSVRRFQISRSSTPVNILRSAGAGVQKRRGEGPVAVLVEKLRRKPHSRQASLVADAAVRAATGEEEEGEGEVEPARPRKRPVVNHAERKWREERKGAISAAKEHITQVLEEGAKARQSNWEDESERLAQEFEQIALELEGEMQTETDHPFQPAVQTTARPVRPKPALKYQPRTPNKHRPAAQGVQDQAEDVQAPVEIMVHDEDDSDGEYVYDTYIRRPLPEGTMLTNPLVDLELDQEKWLQQHGIDAGRPDIGVIVITQEDEEYWEHFAEDDEDEDRWDSEDADSNAENNPANDYPDEDLSWDDEEDDPTAAYHRYRTHAVSDDEEFDFADSASEGRRAGPGGVESRFGLGRDSHVGSDDSFDDLDSDGRGHDSGFGYPRTPGW